jgi:serine/threonine protein kinase
MLTAACSAQGKVHQDVKIDNIFVKGVTPEGAPIVALGDLGSSFSQDDFRLSYTEAYITPEVASILTRLGFAEYNLAEQASNAMVAQALVSFQVRPCTVAARHINTTPSCQNVWCVLLLNSCAPPSSQSGCNFCP